MLPAFPPQTLPSPPTTRPRSRAPAASPSGAAPAAALEVPRLPRARAHEARKTAKTPRGPLGAQHFRSWGPSASRGASRTREGERNERPSASFGSCSRASMLLQGRALTRRGGARGRRAVPSGTLCDPRRHPQPRECPPSLRVRAGGAQGGARPLPLSAESSPASSGDEVPRPLPRGAPLQPRGRGDHLHRP